MAAFTIRPGTADDAYAVAAFHVRSWQVGYRGQMPDAVLDALDPAEWGERRHRIMSTPSDIYRELVAVDDAGAVVGFADFGGRRIPPGWENFDPTEGEVYAIYVDPDRWGEGAGRALMDAAVRVLAAENRPVVRLWVLESNVRTRRFYERYGFVADGERDVFTIGEPPVDLPEIRYALYRSEAELGGQVEPA